MIKFLFFFISLIFSIYLSASSEIRIHEHFLKNGLRIIVVPVDSNGIIHFGVRYNIGSVDDPEDKMGLSHFVEHMMFLGTKKVSKERLSYLMDKYCIYYNAITGVESTLYYCSVRKEFLKMMMQIEVDRMQNLKMNRAEFEREKKVIMEERNLRDMDPSNRYLGDTMLRSFYFYSKYAYPIIGYAHHIENIDMESLIKHYKKYYVVNNATLIFVGNIEKEEAVKLAERYFSYLKPSKKKIERRLIQEPLNTGISYFIEKSGPEIKKQELQITYAFDKNILASLKNINVANIMINILFGPSVFTKIMMDEKALISDFEASFKTNSGNKAGLVVTMSLPEGVSIHDVEKEFLKIVHEFKEKYLTLELLEEQKEKDSLSYDFLTDRPGSLFFGIINALADNTVCDLNNQQQIFRNIKLDDLKEMADKILKDQNITHKWYMHP